MFSVTAASLLLGVALTLPPSGTLSGRWLLVERTHDAVELPLVGDAQSVTEARVLYDVVHDDDEIKGEGTVCELEIESQPSVLRPVIPPAFREAVPRQQLDARLSFDGETILFVTKRALTLIGARLTRPHDDPLPDRYDHPAVDDADKDGKPGVTMLIDGFARADVYLAERRWDELQGRMTEPGRIEGKAFHEQEMTLLGSSNPLVQFIPPLEPRRDRSAFTFVKVDDKTTCADVAKRPTPPAPAIAPPTHANAQK